VVNRYDDVRLDVAALLKLQDASLAPAQPSARSGDHLGVIGRLGSIARLYGLGALVKFGWHRRLVYANLRLDWFFEFQRYWVEELGNRPIHPHDFYFLAGVYRQRLQTIYFEQIENPDLASDERHLEACSPTPFGRRSLRSGCIPSPPTCPEAAESPSMAAAPRPS